MHMTIVKSGNSRAMYVHNGKNTFAKYGMHHVHCLNYTYIHTNSKQKERFQWCSTLAFVLFIHSLRLSRTENIIANGISSTIKKKKKNKNKKRMKEITNSKEKTK